MTSHDGAPRNARDDTDSRLLAERTKTDAELAKTREVEEHEADEVIELARRRAEETLREARALADLRVPPAAGTASRAALAADRAAEDGAVAMERAAADASLQSERQAHERALSLLLHREREATDDGLVVERACSDEVVTTRDDFLGMVSHDLRGMISSIGLHASMLLKQASTGANDPQGTVRRSEGIVRAAARMDRLVGDLLDVVSLEAGVLRVAPRAHDANQLVNDATEAFHPAYAAKGVALTTEKPEGRLPVHVDPDRVLQVLANLLSNALKFTPQGGHVVVSVARDEAGVRFAVRDTGIGIPIDQTTAIFERFRQVRTHDRRGLGLGLYIAKCIVEAHGGAIWAEPQKAGGTVIQFTLRAVGSNAVTT